MTGNNPLLAAALNYAQRGWSVFPLHSPTETGCSCRKETCSSIGKHPRTRKGVKDATTDTKQIERWWEKWPDANIGLCTGQQSGLLVLDIDDKHDDSGSKSLAKLTQANGELPETLIVSTGHGRHFYFRHPGLEIKNRVGTAGAGIDIRSDGGYVVAPPSLHMNGRTYAIVREQDVSEMPAWLVEAVTKPESASASPADEGEHNPLEDAPIIPQGERNQTVFTLACVLRGQHNMEREQMEPMLIEFNQRKCVPPLPEDEVFQIAANACKYPAQAKRKSAKRQEENPLYWYKFNLRDWFSKQNVVLMDDRQTGWYIRLVAFAWQNGGFLPADQTRLSKLAGAKSRATFRKHCALVLEEFEPAVVNGQPMLRNEVMAAQHSQTVLEWMKKRDAGLASLAKRTGKKLLTFPAS